VNVVTRRKPPFEKLPSKDFQLKRHLAIPDQLGERHDCSRSDQIKYGVDGSPWIVGTNFVFLAYSTLDREELTFAAEAEPIITPE
jgi:hypothetical protein